MAPQNKQVLVIQSDRNDDIMSAVLGLGVSDDIPSYVRKIFPFELRATVALDGQLQDELPSGIDAIVCHDSIDPSIIRTRFPATPVIGYDAHSDGRDFDEHINFLRDSNVHRGYRELVIAVVMKHITPTPA